ncbi:MAG TPA: metallophosphoesterase family protein [Burkholderiaceae bacterium]|nr:metallophosphoesterase family protein [Burkholderiaceae bacterium]
MRIGLISDTHNLLRPQALAWLQGCAHIVHAGDICAPHVLTALSALAPVHAVRGNNDVGDWAEGLPEALTVELGGVRLHVVHDLKTLALDPVAQGIDVVVSGHSHRPLVEQHGPVLYVNPGSAGPRRFKLPVSVGELRMEDGKVRAQLAELAA